MPKASRCEICLKIVGAWRITMSALHFLIGTLAIKSCKCNAPEGAWCNIKRFYEIRHSRSAHTHHIIISVFSLCASAGPTRRSGPCTQRERAAAFYALARREIDLWMQLEFIVHYQRSRRVGRMLYCVLCMLNQYINLHKCSVCMPCLPLKTNGV